MRNGKVYGKTVLTVYVFDFSSILYFCLPIIVTETDSASLFTIDVIKNIILSCFNFCKSSQ